MNRPLHALTLIAAALFSGAANAVLLSPSVEATINAHGAQTNASQLSGPVTVANSGTHYSFGAWTDYGIQRAASSLAVSTSWSSPVAYGGATSKWTDALRISTPDVAAGQPVNLRFSVRLDGHLGGHADNFTNSFAGVQFNMFLNEYGSWVTQPSYRIDLGIWSGSDLAVDVNETLTGEFSVPNGAWFNLISDLSTSVQGNLWGPPGSASAESLFGNSATWLGGAVWVNGNPASSFTIESGSGFDYSQAAVPVPTAAWLFGSGLLGLVGVARRKRGI